MRDGLRLALGGFGVLVALFLMLPILIIIPLSFNPEPYFSFTGAMLRLEPEGSGRGVITGASALYDELRRLTEADLGDVPPSGTSLSSLRA